MKPVSPSIQILRAPDVGRILYALNDPLRCVLVCCVSYACNLPTSTA